ncbi:uncharacterized protein LOC143648536 [Tamandua tetradactyla]|uniref:uncharacterized protein LOC143648536 n=1 Tax=Tamandua tetradactyla TaxID=48850 RepID=UPI004053807D
MSARLTLSASLAARPLATALLPPPPSPPWPSPSPRRSTPFSSSAKFLNPFFPLPPIVTGAEACRPGPGSSQDLRNPSVLFSFLPSYGWPSRGSRAGRQREDRVCRKRSYPQRSANI